MTAPITTVLLDLDETILSDDGATEAALMQTALHAQTVADIDPHEMIEALRSKAAKRWRKGPFPEWLDGIGTSEIEGLRAQFKGDDKHWAKMRKWGPDFRRASWKKALESLGVEDRDLALSLDMMFERERAETNPWLPGAQEAMDWLGERYKLGLVTNGIPDVQRTKINATGLVERFAAIVVSGEIGVGKPDRGIYHYAVQMLGAQPENTIMVGDNFRRDVLGAQAFGIRGVWLSLGRDQPEGGEPWLVVESLAELPAALTIIDVS